MKKVLLIVLVLFTFGCTDKAITVKKTNGDSLTYNFFKDFDTNKYCVYFFDRNTSVNDNTKIIFGRDNDKYYYEINGVSKQKIIQKEGYRYTISGSSYFKEESEVIDYSKGILPSDISYLKTKGYVTGREIVFNKRFVYEKYSEGKENTIYYFDGDKLSYVKYEGIQNVILLKFNKFAKVDPKIFEIDDELLEISY